MRTANIGTNVEFPRKKFMLTATGILTIDLSQCPEGTSLEDYIEEAKVFALKGRELQAQSKQMQDSELNSGNNW